MYGWMRAKMHALVIMKSNRDPVNPSDSIKWRVEEENVALRIALQLFRCPIVHLGILDLQVQDSHVLCRSISANKSW